MADLKYAAKLTFGQGAVQEGVGINVPRMIEERSARVKALMKQKGIPTLLVPGEPNVRYLTGFFWREFGPAAGYTLFFADHDPVVFAPAGSYQQVPDQMPWIKHWRIARSWLQQICGPEAAREEAKLFATEISKELEERGLTKEKVGIILFDDLAKEALRNEGLTLVESSLLLLEASKIKTPDEINCAKMVASMCNVGLQLVSDIVKPGMTDSQLYKTIVAAMADAGSENPRCGVWSGPMSFERGLSPYPRRIEYGDIMYVNVCANQYMGYHSCIYRTFLVGRKPTAKEKGWYDRVKERLDRAIEATKIGNTTADAAKAFDPASRWGYKDEADVLTIEFGHGIGLVSIHSPAVHYGMPVINRQWSLKHPQPFEEGMVIAYESAEGEHRVGGARLENMVVVTKEGAEIIDHFPREEIIVV